MSVTKRDYYEILGVSRDCDEQTLKSSYRKLALQYHPDRNPNDPVAEEKFKEAAEAYAVLSDGQKRSSYDRFGHQGVNFTGGGFADSPGFADFSDILGDLFGFGDVFGENVKEEIVPLERRDILHGGLGRSGGEGEADSGAGEVDDGDTQEESDGGEDFEVEETLPAYAADFAHVTMTCDAGDERTENKRSDDNFDEAEKDIAEDAQVRGEVGPIEAKLEAAEHGEENPVSKGAFVQASVGKDSERGQAQGGDP